MILNNAQFSLGAGIVPFPFQKKLRDHFKNQAKTWSWFSEVKIKKEQNELAKTELLKNAYRLDRESNLELYELLDKAKQRLGLTIAATIYQTQNGFGNNASVSFFDEDAHIVLSGAVIKLLTDDELLALFGHELSHVLLFKVENNEFEITHRIVNSIASDYSSDLYYYETARLFMLYTELYCDLGAMLVCENSDTVIQLLLKMNTGLEAVSAISYLKQVEEILERTAKGSEGQTHPEEYIRAKALQLYLEKQEASLAEIEKLVNGKLDLYRLNLFAKDEIYSNTKKLINLILKPNWTQSDFTQMLYRQYFKNYDRNAQAELTEQDKNHFENITENLKDYYAYVMLDFALCDSDVKEPFLAHILDFSEQIGIDVALKTAIKKELALTEKGFKDMHKLAAATLNVILESEKESSY